MTEQVRLTVNGVEREVSVEPRRLLVQTLREDLGLTGTHVGCDTSQCGACTVHLDGHAVKSCSVLAVQADGHVVTTIEGMASAEGLHPIQTAFWEKHGLPCGFCTPGMIMAAAVEKALIGTAGDGAAIAKAAAHAVDGVTVASDIHADAEYRAQMARVETRRAIEAALAAGD